MRDGNRERQRAREGVMREVKGWKRGREPGRGEIAHERVRVTE
jgi:hypothetical protein